jgi:hypothetical protein
VLHTLSAYASNARLVLGQLSVPEKTNEITAIPELLDHLAETSQLQGALVTIDAMGCQVAVADKIVEHQAHYLLAPKGNQPTLEARCRATQPRMPALGMNGGRQERLPGANIGPPHPSAFLRFFATSGNCLHGASWSSGPPSCWSAQELPR